MLSILIFTLFMMPVNHTHESAVSGPHGQEVTIEGGIIFVGNEPFAIPALYDENDKRYFLTVTEQMKRDMAANAGKKVIVKGHLCEDTWAGRPALFIKVTSYEWIEE
jgi:hypothetical protein